MEREGDGNREEDAEKGEESGERRNVNRYV
jgi:hypothetical protein